MCRPRNIHRFFTFGYGTRSVPTTLTAYALNRYGSTGSVFRRLLTPRRFVRRSK